MEIAKIEDVVGEFVNLKRRGVNMIGNCPFHNEKTPSFTVSPTKNIYKCFGCGNAGNPVKFIMEHENQTYPEALRYLAGKYGIEIEEIQLSAEAIAEKQQMDSLYIINEFAKAFYQKNLMETDFGKSVGLSYFKSRGYNEETIKKFGLGIALQQKDALTLEAQQKGYSIDMMKKLGLTSQYGRDFFRDRVMFTIHSMTGKPIAFAGRILQKDVKAPKYVNSPETEIYYKSKVLYGAYFAKKSIRKLDECIMVEGYTDVISLHQAGIENVVASSGTSLTVEQIRLIKRFTPNMKILYDGDAAGTKAALRGLDLVLEQDMNVKVVMLPDGEDPDSYVKAVGVTAMQEYMTSQAKDFILFKAGLLLGDAENDPVKKTAVIKDIVGSIAKIPDPIKRQLYIKQVSSLMGVTEEVLTAEVNNSIRGIISKRKQEKRLEQIRLDRQGGGITQGPPPGQGAPFPDVEIPTDAAPPKAAKGHEFQEKDIARILVTLAEQNIEEENMTVGEFIMSNIDDTIDAFDSKIYQRLVQSCMERMKQKKKLDQAFFLNHPDGEIQKFAISVIQPEHEMSTNWEEKHEIFLRQKAPDLNFDKDSKSSILRFKLKKIDRLCKENQARLKEADPKKMMKLLKLQMRLTDMRNSLAAELRTVVL